MKIELPLATWTDVFGIVPRSQLAKFMPHFGEEKRRKRTRQGRICSSIIGNRQFVSAVQFYLHKCGQITLDVLKISKHKHGDPPLLVNRAEMELPLEEVPPISKNIKSFKKIIIRDYEESILQFLEQFSHNAMFTDVNLELYYDYDYRHEENALIQFLPKFSLLVTSIESIELGDENVLARLEEENFGRELFTSARVLLISDNFDFGKWYRRWLLTPRRDNKPRVLIGSNEQMQQGATRFRARFTSQATPYSHQFTSFVTKIKKDFLEANQQAVSFFVKVYNPSPWLNLISIQSESVDNNMTQEKLVFKGVDNDHLTISRYPMKASVEWIEEMEKSVEDMEEEWNNGDQKRKIELNFRN